MLASPTLLERTSAARNAADCLQPLQLPARRASSSSEPPTAERLAALSRQQLTLPQGPASVRCSVSSAGSHGARSRENSVSGSEAGRATASAEPFAQPPAEWWLASLSRADIVLLLGGYLVLFIRYLVSQQLAGFFTAVADDADSVADTGGSDGFTDHSTDGSDGVTDHWQNPHEEQSRQVRQRICGPYE